MGGTNCLPSRGRGLFICTLVKGSRHKYTTIEVNRDRGKQERKHKVELGGDMQLCARSATLVDLALAGNA